MVVFSLSVFIAVTAESLLTVLNPDKILELPKKFFFFNVGPTSGQLSQNHESSDQ